MRILIYGATGYIGRNLSEYLLSLGYIVGNVSRSELNLIGIENFSFESDVEVVISIFKPNKIIYMSACFDNEDVSNIVDVNIKKPLEILKKLECYNIEFIYIGSYWQFGNYNKPNVAIDLYSASKNAIIPFFDYYNEYTNVSCKEVVLYGVYGENDTRGKLLDYLIQMANESKIVNLTSGEQKLNLVNIKNICFSIEKILFIDSSKFKILSERSYTPKDIVGIIKKYKNIDVNFGVLPYRRVELMDGYKNINYSEIIIKDDLEGYIKSFINYKDI